MTIVRRLEKRWLKDEALQGLDLEGAKAVVDALALTMYADLESDASEETALMSVILSLPTEWSSSVELHEHAQNAGEAAAKLATADAVLAKVPATASAIPESVREQVFGMLVAMSIADREIKDGEAGVLDAFREGLGFDEEKGAALYNETLTALGLEENKG